jgi:HSP20 family protein
MLIRYWSPFTELEKVRRQIDRAFEQITDTIEHQPEANWRPSIELKDQTDRLILKAHLPGIEPKDLDIQVTQDSVSLSGERRSEPNDEKLGYYYTEFLYGKFHRVLNLPAPIIHDQVHVEFTNGLLTLTLPKVVESREKVVKFNLAEVINPPENPVLEGNS